MIDGEGEGALGCHKGECLCNVVSHILLFVKPMVCLSLFSLLLRLPKSHPSTTLAKDLVQPRLKQRFSCHWTRHMIFP